MNLKCAVNRRLRLFALCLSVLPVLAILTHNAFAQTPNEEPKPAETKVDETKLDQEPYRTFYLTYATDRQSLNDIQTDLRNMIPRAKIFGVQSENAITIRGTADEIAMAQKLIADLDKPRKIYRLTYTITDGDLPAKIDQHYMLIVASGDKTVFKQGDRVPIITGRTGDKDNPAQPSSQVQYVDVGINIDATLTTSADALMLSTKFELSSVANPTGGLSAGDPDIRQTVLQETSTLTPDKPLVLGSLDLPGTTRSQQIQVVAELVR
jgi:type II secretory pathway component GspD/PulD (secretin)